MRRAAVRNAIKPDCKVETIAATVASLQASIESIDRALADEQGRWPTLDPRCGTAAEAEANESTGDSR